MNRKKIITSFFILVIIVLSTDLPLGAQNESRRPSSMKKPDFLTLAQDNDTLIALTNMFFRKRKEAQTGFIIAGVSFPVFAMGTALFAVGSGMQGADDPTEDIQVGAVVFSVAFYGLIIGSGHRLIRYNKQRLNNLMQSYPIDGEIPQSLRKQLRPKDFR
ncbi:MAG TPA: hypothetical protein PKE03_11305 [Bacteroidales bacterium]|mgnify:CR=1 FL=1|nr:hypothetical protein [Bacteroidales bacterium]